MVGVGGERESGREVKTGGGGVEKERVRGSENGGRERKRERGGREMKNWWGLKWEKRVEGSEKWWEWREERESGWGKMVSDSTQQN